VRSVKGTKQKLLETYLLEVYRNGIQNLSLLSLSKAADVAFGTVHYHFGKKDIFLEALEFSDQNGRRFVDERMASVRGKDALENYFKVNFEWIRERPQHATFWLYFIYESGRNRQYAKLNQSYSLESISKIATLLEKEASLPGRKIQSLAEKLFQLLLGSMVFSLCHAESPAKTLKNALEMKRLLIQEHQ
jgi:AcrR family transcriptional regulator